MANAEIIDSQIVIILPVERVTAGLKMELEEYFNWNSITVFKGIFTFAYCTSLTILLSTPVGFFACLGRGYLSPLAFIIFTVLFSQLGSAFNLGEYIPWSVPALANGITRKMIFNLGSIISLFGVSILGCVSTIIWWRCTDYN